MDDEKLANLLAILGNKTRLQIYKFLIKVGKDGINVASIKEHLNIPASTLSHHISKLLNADIIKQTRVKKELICTANYELLEMILNELKDQCCVGVYEIKLALKSASLKTHSSTKLRLSRLFLWFSHPAHKVMRHFLAYCLR